MVFTGSFQEHVVCFATLRDRRFLRVYRSADLETKPKDHYRNI